MGSPKGRPRPPGAGRKKGTLNKITQDVKAMIEAALHDAGGKLYLIDQAHENPVAFLTLVGKIIPRDLHLSGTVNLQGLLADLAAELKSRKPAPPGGAA